MKFLLSFLIASLCVMSVVYGQTVRSVTGHIVNDDTGPAGEYRIWLDTPILDGVCNEPGLPNTGKFAWTVPSGKIIPWKPFNPGNLHANVFNSSSLEALVNNIMANHPRPKITVWYDADVQFACSGGANVVRYAWVEHGYAPCWHDGTKPSGFDGIAGADCPADLSEWANNGKDFTPRDE